MPEVHAALEELLHGDDGHGRAYLLSRQLGWSRRPVNRDDPGLAAAPGALRL
jgi:hypothetical protein